jgi:hypothetical protein
MSTKAIKQMERIAGMVEQILACAHPKNPKARRLTVKLAKLDQAIALRKDREGKTI